MNPIKYLADTDFKLVEGKKGLLLANNLPGVSIVLFYSKKCEYCAQCIPVFVNLSRMIPSCQFAMLNVSTYYNVASSSAKTIAPIDVVPYIVLYVNGRPFMRYNGEKTPEDLGGFIQNVLNHIQSRKNFSTMKVDHQHEIPAYSIAVPYNVVCEGDECYLSFGEAYTKDNPNKKDGNNGNAVSQGHAGYGGMANNNQPRYQGQEHYAPQRRPGMLSGLEHGRAPQRHEGFNQYSGM